MCKITKYFKENSSRIMEGYRLLPLYYLIDKWISSSGNGYYRIKSHK